MRLELFDYPLPEELIAQTPVEPRDSSRLLHLPANGGPRHLRFLDLPDLLQPGDLLVFNDTRVQPARVLGRKSTGAHVELLLLTRLAAGRWEALAFPARRLQPGVEILFGPEEAPTVCGRVVGVGSEGTRMIEFRPAEASGDCNEASAVEADLRLHALGSMPLPPYIHQRLDDPERYQTLYAREEGSAAAPTAGLHFTPRVFHTLEQRGVRTAFVTLHVGIGTFRPVKTETIQEHRMHEEWYSLPAATARAINECTGRVIAVGTTTVRTLESAAASAPGHGERPTLAAGAGKTSLYITPGYPFRVVDAMLTNFHMPKSSLVIMVSAFAGHDRVMAAYAEAVRERYRFFSFGDACFIERPKSGTRGD